MSYLNSTSIARKRYTFSVSTFYGVDYSKPALQVDDSRAIDILNFLWKDGVNQKRDPWEQMAQVPLFSYYYLDADDKYEQATNTNEIFNIWSFKAEDGARHIIAHVGKCLYEVLNIGSNQSFKNVTFQPLYQIVSSNNETIKATVELKPKKVMAFISGNRLWVLGGTKFYCIRFTSATLTDTWAKYLYNDNAYIAPVEDFAFVPATTIAIVETDSEVTTGDVTLDAVNLLTPKRINRLLTGTVGDTVVRTTRFHEFTLDSDIKGDLDDVSIELKYREAQ